MNNSYGKFWQHTIEGTLKTQDPNRIIGLQCREGLLENFRHNIIMEDGDWVVTLKDAPYSGEDFMIIYAGQDDRIIKLDQFNDNELTDLFDIIQKVYNGLEKKYHDLKKGKKQLILGVNTSKNPGAGSMQSVPRPHVHISIFNTPTNTEGLEDNGVKTIPLGIDISNISEYYKKLLCIRDNNNKCEKRFLELIGRDKEINIGYFISPFQSIDFYLGNNEDIFGNKNRESIMRIYYYALKTINEFKGNKNPGFTIGFKKDENNNLIVRLKFVNREEGDGSGVMESFGHIVIRTLKKDPYIPNLDKYRKLIGDILNSKT